MKSNNQLLDWLYFILNIVEGSVSTYVLVYVQVKFTIDGDFMPIPESSLRSAIKENYSNGKFSSELTLAQVNFNQHLLIL